MDNTDSVSLILNNLNEPVNFSEYEEEIMKPLTYLAKYQNKTMTSFFDVLKHWFDIPKDKLKLIEEIYERVYETTEA